jgi:tol-pal system protein YbgF
VKLFSTIFCAIFFCLMAIAPAYSANVNAEVIQRLERIERLLQSQGLLDMLQQIEALQQELSALHGEIEFQNHTLEQLKKRQRDLYTDVDQRLQGLEKGGIADSSTALDTIIVENQDDGAPPLQTLEPIANDIRATTASQQAESPLRVEVLENSIITPVVEPTMEQQLAAVTPPADNSSEVILTPMETTTELDPVQIRAQYQQAFKLLKQSQYEQATKAFREFLLVNPQSEYSDNAQYWLGEAYYVTRQFDQALVEYNALLNNYPDSKKLTHSLLKIGFCYHELGQTEEALSRLEKLKQEYPGTTAARLADERLKKIAQAEQQATEAVN